MNGMNFHLNTSDFLLVFMGLNLSNLSHVSLVCYIHDSCPMCHWYVIYVTVDQLTLPLVGS